MNSISAMKGRGVVIACAAWALSVACLRAQHYQLSVTPENLARQALTFTFTSEPASGEVRIRLAVGPREIATPSNLVATVLVRKEERKVLDVNIKPVWESGKAVFIFSLRQDYVPLARLRLRYSEPNPAAPRGRKTVDYNFSLGGFLAPPPAPAASPVPETPQPEGT